MKRFGIRIYKEYFNFACAHFLIFDDSRREELHGHNYQVQMSLEGELAETQGVFIDFLHIKPIVKTICDSIDHRTILPQNNPYLSVEKTTQGIRATYSGCEGHAEWLFPERDTMILPIINTSSERLAEYLCGETLKQLKVKYPDALIQKMMFSVEESRGQAAEFRFELDTPTALQYLDENLNVKEPVSV